MPAAVPAAFTQVTVDYAAVAPMLVVVGRRAHRGARRGLRPARAPPHDPGLADLGRARGRPRRPRPLEPRPRGDHPRGLGRHRRRLALPPGRPADALGHQRPRDGGALRGCRVRRLHPDGSLDAGVHPGGRRDPRRVRHLRGLPARALRGARDDDLRQRQRPHHPVRRARGALAAALHHDRARPSPAAAVAGGGAEVLPPRGVLERVLPLRRRAALRLRRVLGPQGDLARDHDRRRRPRRPAPAGCRAHPRRPALQGRRRAVPLVDPGRLPGRPDPGHRLHGGLHQARGVRRDPPAHLRRASARTAGTGRSASSSSPSSRWSSVRCSR